MNERKKDQPLAAIYLPYLKKIIEEYNSIRKKYALLRGRVKNDPNLLTAESLVPIIANIYHGLQKGTIVPKKGSYLNDPQNKVKNILDSLLTMIETSTLPRIQIDPKTKKIMTDFPSTTVSPSSFKVIKLLLKNFQINDVVYDARYEILENLENNEVPKKLIETIQSFLDFDEKYFLALPSKQSSKESIILVKGSELQPLIAQLPHWRLQEKLQNLKDLLNYYPIPQKFLKQFGTFISEIKNHKKSINLSNGIITLDFDKTIALWEIKKLNLELMIEHNEKNIPIATYISAIQQIKESLENITVKNTFEGKRHLRTKYDPERLYRLTFEEAQKLGIITQTQSEEIKEIIKKQPGIEEKQALCQRLQNAIQPREPERAELSPPEPFFSLF